MRRVHYVFSSHWDREWYQPFQDFRYRLVQMLDRVLEGWRSGRLRGPFQTDGQAILVEDYLEIRPEAETEVRQRVREGKLVLGPFYVQPDEFLVSGESLIRNLRLGRVLARRWGGTPSNAGLLADNFGHNSQMPQIFAGFGIRAGFVWRGTNLVHRRLFIWRGADGTALPCYRFGAEGYCSYAKFVRQQRLDQPRFTAEQLDQRLESFLKDEAAKTQAGPLLAFDGGDHMEWDPAAYAVLACRIDGTLDGPANGSQLEGGSRGAYQIVHTSLDAYLEELLPFTGEIDTCLTGELREPARHPEKVDKGRVALGTGASRVWIKQSNAACETLLCRWAEPFAACADVFQGAAFSEPARSGSPAPPGVGGAAPAWQGFLDTAWKWLLQNQPHDSICGCSIDAVHADMPYRFHQSAQIANRLAVEATRRLALHIQGDISDNELRCVVFNPSPRPYHKMGVLDLELPATWETGPTPERPLVKPAFSILDEQGGELPYQRLSQALSQPRLRVLETAFPLPYCVNLVRVALPLDLPPLGYTTLTIRKREDGLLLSPPQPDFAGVTAGVRSMANEFLAVTLEPNGTLTLTDRRTGNTYHDLLTFEDSADTGDGWGYHSPPNNATYFSSGCQAEIVRLHAGPLLAAFQVRTTLDLPEEFDFSRQARTVKQAGLQIESLVTLRAGADQVEIETRVQNNIRDHRLRVLFPTHTGAETYLADTPFDVIERPVALPPDNHLYLQPHIETRPQQSFTACFDLPANPPRGLAVISPGLYESTVQDSPERPIALTLFRATRRTVFTASEPGGQVQGELAFQYALIPLRSALDPSSLFERAGELAAGLRTVQLARSDQDLYYTQSGLPASFLPRQASFLSLEGPLVLTSLRFTGTGLEARVFNPNTIPAEGKLSLAGWPANLPSPSQVTWVDFESHPVEPPFHLEGHTVAFSVKPKQIRTLCFLLARRDSDHGQDE